MPTFNTIDNGESGLSVRNTLNDVINYVNTGITSGVSYTYITEDTTPGSENLTILVTDGTNTSTETITPNSIISEATDVALTILDTISIDPQLLGNGTGIKSEDTTTSGFTQTTHTPTSIDILATDGTTSVSSNVYTTGASITSNDGLRTNNISVTPNAVNGVQLTSNNTTTSDVGQIDISDTYITAFSSYAAGLITDTLSVDPQLLGNGTGIKSEDTTTGIYSQTTHTPTDIILASVDGAGETTQIVISNLGGNGVEIQTGDANNYSTINITSAYTTLSLNDIPNNLVDALVLDTGNTGITSEDTLSGNISSSIYTPNGITSQANDVASTITDTITLDPQGLTATGTGIRSNNTLMDEDTILSVFPNGFNVYQNTSGLTTTDITMGISNTFIEAIDIPNNITDTISVDPLLINNGTGIKSTDGTNTSTQLFTPTDLTSTSTDGTDTTTETITPSSYDILSSNSGFTTTINTAIGGSATIDMLSTDGTNTGQANIYSSGLYLNINDTSTYDNNITLNGNITSPYGIQMYSQNPSSSDNGVINLDATAINQEVTDGTTTSSFNIEVSDSGIGMNMSDGIDWTGGISVSRNTVFGASDTNTSMGTQNLTGITSAQITTSTDNITDLSNITLQITNSLTQPVGIYIVDDGIRTNGIPSFDDDTAASGLTAGSLYQTTGAGASPLDVVGILMVKQ